MIDANNTNNKEIERKISADKNKGSCEFDVNNTITDVLRGDGRSQTLSQNNQSRVKG